MLLKFHTLNCSPGMADITMVTLLGSSLGIQSLSPAPLSLSWSRESRIIVTSLVRSTVALNLSLRDFKSCKSKGSHLAQNLDLSVHLKQQFQWIPPCFLLLKMFIITQSRFFFRKNSFFVGDIHMSYFGATGTPVLDFWWRFLWVLKPEWVLPYSHCEGECNVHFLRSTSGATQSRFFKNSWDDIKS